MKWLSLVSGCLAIASVFAYPSVCEGARVQGKGRGINWAGADWVSLDMLVSPFFLDAQTTITNWHRDIYTTASTGAGTTIYEGGLFYSHDDGVTTHPLRRPLLVVEGRHFIELDEGAAVFGYSYSTSPTLSLNWNKKFLGVEVSPLTSQYYRAGVSHLDTVSTGVQLETDVQMLRDLHETTQSQLTVMAGTRMLVRRKVNLLGVPHFIVTEADGELGSYLCAAADLAGKVKPDSLDDTLISTTLQRLRDMADETDSVYHGKRADLQESVAVTADFCWSLRAWEGEFFDAVRTSSSLEQQRWLTAFLSGRWMEQHPEEMHKLIELSRAPGVGITWGLHSWEHPKDGLFMNAWSPAELRKDTLKLETLMLQWGLVPSVYYRFPGLIHDKARLLALADLNLLSIDCDSWVTGMRLRRAPTRLPATNGSIMLIHGNGNEAKGIPILHDWFLQHPDWKWEKLSRFIPGFNEPPDEQTTETLPAVDDRETTEMPAPAKAPAD